MPLGKGLSVLIKRAFPSLRKGGSAKVEGRCTQVGWM